MHPNLVNTRTGEARGRIRSAAAALAERRGIAPLVAFTTDERRQAAIAHMRELETIADVLEALVQQEADHGSKQEGRSRSRG